MNAQHFVVLSAGWDVGYAKPNDDWRWRLSERRNRRRQHRPLPLRDVVVVQRYHRIAVRHSFAQPLSTNDVQPRQIDQSHTDLLLQTQPERRVISLSKQNRPIGEYDRVLSLEQRNTAALRHLV